jgi:predicted ATPase
LTAAFVDYILCPIKQVIETIYYGDVMADLLLPSLEIDEFRAYRHLLIEQFGRVNLIVGKNNVGKSTLLEALWLYTQRARPHVILGLLGSRDELYSFTSEDSTKSQERIWKIKHLFHGHEIVSNTWSISKVITIGPVNVPDQTLRLAIGWYVTEEKEGIERRRIVKDPNLYPGAEPYILIGMGAEIAESYKLDQIMDGRSTFLISKDLKVVPSKFIKANGLSAQDIPQLWDNIALTDLEETVVDALHIIAPEVERINFLGGETMSGRIPVAKIKGVDEPVRLRSMGEGMNRLLGIVLALVNARNGILLIDEVESGLHYTVQTDIWRTVFNAAQKLNVQVFATTHSWDCIQAFQEAAVEDTENEGLLIRLENRESEIGATLFSERQLSIATREEIEVR